LADPQIIFFLDIHTLSSLPIVFWSFSISELIFSCIFDMAQADWSSSFVGKVKLIWVLVDERDLYFCFLLFSHKAWSAATKSVHLLNS